MISANEAEMARAHTKSTLCTPIINLEIRDTPADVKKERCLEIEAILREFSLSFEKAFPAIISKFATIAKKTNVDPASLYCIYLENTTAAQDL